MPEDDISTYVRTIDSPKAMVYRPNKPQLKKREIQDNHIKNHISQVTRSMKNEQKSNLPTTIIPFTDKSHTMLTKTQIRPLNNRVLRFVRNKENGIKLLMFLKRNNVLMNDVGEVYYQNKTFLGTYLEELFCDILNGSRKTPPKNHELFYNILKDLNIDVSLLSKRRVKYFE